MTAKSVLDDYTAGALAPAGRACAGGDAVRTALAPQGKPLVDFSAWARLDELEISRGAAAGKVREKLVSIEEMLAVATG